MSGREDSFEDIGIRLGAQDVEWMLASVDLMLATSKMAQISDGTEKRMMAIRDQLAIQSALPRHSPSYSDSFRYTDAITAVRECDAWEARLVLDRKSFFKDCRIAIETHKDGKRRNFKLTSDLRLGHDSEQTAHEAYGVYLNRLVEVCQGVAPEEAVQVEECRLRVLADWRRYLDMDHDVARDFVGGVIQQAIETHRPAGPVVIRDVDLARWTADDEKSLPEHLRYLDVTLSASSEAYARLSEFASDYNEQIRCSAQVIPLRVG